MKVDLMRSDQRDDSVSAQKSGLRSLVEAVLIGLIALSINMLLPLRGPFGLDILFGGVLIAAMLPGSRGWWLCLAAMIAALPTIYYWHHGWAIPVWTLEVMWLIALRGRVNMVLADLGFWILAGGPLTYLILHYSSNLAESGIYVLLLKQMLNSLMVVAIGRLLVTLHAIYMRRTRTGPLRQYLTGILLPMAAMPMLLMSYVFVQHEMAQRLDENAVHLHSIAREVIADLRRDRGAQGALPVAGTVLSPDFRLPAHIDLIGPASVWIAQQGRPPMRIACAPDCRAAPAWQWPVDAMVMPSRFDDIALILPGADRQPIERWYQLTMIARTSLPPGLSPEPGSQLVIFSRSQDLVPDAMRDIAQVLAMLSVITLLCLLGSLFLSRMITRPIEAMIVNLRAGDRAISLPNSHVLSGIRELDDLQIALDDRRRSLIRAEEEVAMSEARLTRITQDVPILFASWKGRGDVLPAELDYVLISPQLRLDLSAQDARISNKLLATLHPDDLPRVQAQMKEVEVQGYATLEYRVRDRDGNWRWIHAGVSGNCIKPKLYEWVTIAIDVTELRMAQQRFSRTEELTLLGRLSAGVAHELNQPLNVIRLAAGNALSRLGEGVPDAAECAGMIDYARDKLQRTLKQVERASEIISRMNWLKGGNGHVRNTFDLATMLDECIGIMRPQLARDNIVIAVEPGLFGPVAIFGDRQGLRQVMISLILNARDAIAADKAGEVGTICIRYWSVAEQGRAEQGRAEQGRAEQGRGDLGQGDRGRIAIAISDDGPGFAPQAMARLFEPFFSLKEPGQGLGLDLATCYAFVQEHKGEITAENLPGSGAQVTVILPMRPVGGEADAPIAGR